MCGNASRLSTLRVTLGAATLLASASLSAATPTSWFTQDYSGLVPSASAWTDTLGTWANVADNQLVDEGGVKYLSIGGGATTLDFVPNGYLASTNALTKVSATMVFTATDDIEELTPASSQAGLALVYDAATGENLVFAGYTQSGWQELTAAGISPAEDTPYSVAIEIKYDAARSGNPYAIAAQVRYSVNGSKLQNAQGEEWFNGPRAYHNLKRFSKISFAGYNGKVGTFSATRELIPEARATINVPIVRANTGTAFNFTSGVVTNQGATLSGNLTWKWYAGNWRGEYGEAPLAETESVTPTSANYAQWIKGEVYDDNGYAGEGRFWYSKLPVMYITTDDGAMPTAAKEEHTGILKIQGNDEFKDDYNGAITIKVRGNTTAGLPKKPYKIKLDSKANLFSLGGAKNKHWVLLANYLDESLMRNKLAYDYAGQLGLVHLKSTWVDVVFNGEYIGVYQVCPHIRIAEDRINIFDWEAEGETAADAIAAGAGMAKADKKALEAQMAEDFAWVTTDAVSYGGVTYKVSDYYADYSKLDISGGYLFESSHEYDEVSKFTCLNMVGEKTNLIAYVMLNKPEFLYTNPTMMNYCSNYWQRVIDAWAGVKGKNSAGEHWSELCDVPSMASYWWVISSMLNSDATYKSRYCYLPVEGKLTFGPVWDFDYGVGGIPVRGTPTVDPITGKKTYAPASYVNWGPGCSTSLECWQREWGSDPLFLKRVYKCYTDTLDYFHSFFADGGLVDQYAEYLDESATANEQIWFYAIGFNGEEGDVQSLKTFLANRSGWLDTNMATFTAFTNSVAKTKCMTNPYLEDVPPEVTTSLSGKVSESELESWMNVNYPAVTNTYGVAWPGQYQALVDQVDAQGRSPTGKSQPFAADYIAGTDPQKQDSLFKATITVVDGEIEVGWDPDLNEGGTKAVRAYTLKGKATLDPQEEWGTVTDKSRFFKVEVNLP